jgi:hypothetical protein
MQFTGNEDHSISLLDASRLTKNYRQKAGAGAQLGGFFGKSAIEAIINQSECVGLRIYNAILDDGKPTFVLCGVKANGDDIVNGELAEIAVPCPPNCPGTKELIS